MVGPWRMRRPSKHVVTFPFVIGKTTSPNTYMLKRACSIWRNIVSTNALPLPVMDSDKSGGTDRYNAPI